MFRHVVGNDWSLVLVFLFLQFACYRPRSRRAEFRIVFSMRFRNFKCSISGRSITFGLSFAFLSRLTHPDPLEIFRGLPYMSERSMRRVCMTSTISAEKRYSLEIARSALATCPSQDCALRSANSLRSRLNTELRDLARSEPCYSSRAPALTG